MKKILLIPFYSQQDKSTGKFLLHKCCVTRINAFYAEKLSERHEVHVIVPPLEMCSGAEIFPKHVQKHELDIPSDNFRQRTEFPIHGLERLLDGLSPDIVINHNEFIFNPAMEAEWVHFNHLLPLGVNEWMKEWIELSWARADKIVVLSKLLESYIWSMSTRHLQAEVWPTVFPAFDRQHVKKDIDILFVQRCSENNYTHHIEFIEAMKDSDLNIVFTDPTGYLRNHFTLPKCMTVANAESREEYELLLSRSKFAIALMTEDIHGGVAIREAIYAGAMPLLADTQAYRYMIDCGLVLESLFVSLEPDRMRKQIEEAVLNHIPSVQQSIQEKVALETFENGFLRVTI